MRSLLREPLGNFIIFGAVLFAGHAVWQKGVKRADYMITVSADELERQAVIWVTDRAAQYWI